ncbi:hypothetical protein ACFE04_016716 [Oxalis oulophora]
MGLNQTAVLKVGLSLLAVCMAGYIVGLPLYWHIKEGLASGFNNNSHYSVLSSCAPCAQCHCSSKPLLTIPQGLSNASFSDCAKHDPEVGEETEKNFAELLSEELKLRETDAVENQQRSELALLEAKKVMSQFQKEADKCNSGMETCEEAREKSELALVAQQRLTALWEQRARRKSWKEGVTSSRGQSNAKVQSS